MSSFTKIILACVVALFTVSSLHAGSKSKDKSKKDAQYAYWKTSVIDTAIAEEYATAKFPVKPRTGIDSWSDFPFFTATAKRITYMISVAPFEKFIRDEAPEDFDASDYSDIIDLKNNFLGYAAEEIRVDGEDFDEVELLNVEIGQYAGFPCLNLSFRDHDENLSIKKRVVLTDNAVYVLSVESNLTIDAVNDPLADFFLDSLKVISR